MAASWSAGELLVEIEDDGPGFAAEVLSALGEPYVGTRRGRGRMGLGIFISKTLLERTGATLEFANRGRQRGARIRIRWPRARIEESVGEVETGSAT